MKNSITKHKFDIKVKKYTDYEIIEMNGDVYWDSFFIVKVKGAKMKEISNVELINNQRLMISEAKIIDHDGQLNDLQNRLILMQDKFNSLDNEVHKGFQKVSDKMQLENEKLRDEVRQTIIKNHEKFQKTMKSVFNQNKEELRQEFRYEIKQENDKMRDEIHSQMETEHNKLRYEIKQGNNKLRDEIYSRKDSEHNKLREEMRQEHADIRAEMRQGFKEILERLKKIEEDIQLLFVAIKQINERLDRIENTPTVKRELKKMKLS